MNREFKGIWIPRWLTEIVDVTLAAKLTAFYAANHYSDEKINRIHSLTSEDIKILSEKGLVECFNSNGAECFIIKEGIYQLLEKEYKEACDE